jgi:hypothetical protein
MADAAVGYSTGSNQPNMADTRARIQQALRGPASWFVTIAVLSIVNSVLAMSGASIHFIFGLGITQVVDALASRAGATGYVLDFIINGIIAGVFVLIWHFARKGNAAAWYAGIALYVIDGLLLLLFKDILSVAFHAWALYRMYPGLKLLGILKKMDQSVPSGAVSSTY